MDGIWNYIASGGTEALEMAWTPLLDGAENTIGELPEIAARVPSAVEQELQARATELREGLMEQFGGAIGPAVEAAATPAVQGLKTQAAEIVSDVEEATQTAKDTGGPAALQAGSGEALSAILGAMRRPVAAALHLTPSVLGWSSLPVGTRSPGHRGTAFLDNRGVVFVGPNRGWRG
jgi:hypothetical protein